MKTSISSEARKKSDLYLNYGPRKSRFPLNLTYRQINRQTDGRTKISIYRVASLLKKPRKYHQYYILFSKIFYQLSYLLGMYYADDVFPSISHKENYLKSIFPFGTKKKLFQLLFKLAQTKVHTFR